jgi:acyl-CoA thioester hydrolase
VRSRESSKAVWRDGWYCIAHEVTWRELDGIGHVNNAVYFTWFEWARTRYWLDLMEVGRPGPQSIDFIVAHARCDFLAQLSLRDLIETRVRIGEVRNSSFDFHNEIVTTDGTIAARGMVVAVLYDWNGNRNRNVSQALKERIRRFQREEARDADG